MPSFPRMTKARFEVLLGEYSSFPGRHDPVFDELFTEILYLKDTEEALARSLDRMKTDLDAHNLGLVKHEIGLSESRLRKSFK